MELDYQIQSEETGSCDAICHSLSLWGSLRSVRVARSNILNTLQYVPVTGTNMAIRCSRYVGIYSMDQLRASSICLTSKGGTIGACYAHICNDWKRTVSKKVFQISYVGQSKRKLKTRLKEHINDFKKSANSYSVISNHRFDTDHVMDWDIQKYWIQNALITKD